MFWLGVGKTDFIFWGQLMQNYVKLHMTLCNYADAGKLADPKRKTELTRREAYQAESLVELPSLLDWCHYFMLINASALNGPPTEYRMTMEFLNMQGDVRQMRKFSNWFAAFRRLIEFFLFMGGFLVFAANFTTEMILTPSHKHDPIWVKNYYVFGFMHVKMFMMFVGFASQEATLIASGQSYRAKSEKEPEEFNSLRTLKWLTFEKFLSASETIGAWNMQV